MSDNVKSRRMHLIGISLAIDVDADGKQSRRVLAAGFDHEGLSCEIEDFELACKAARAAESVWTGKVA